MNQRQIMRKLFFLSVSILLLLAGCGGEPTPEESSWAEMRAKLESGHSGRFDRERNSTQEIEPNSSRIDDPDTYIYKGRALSQSAQKKWEDVGIDKKEFNQWADLNIGITEAKKWKDLNISYAAISVFHKQKYTPETTKNFIQKNFFKRPQFYAQFGTPVYEFDSICQGVITRQQAPFAFLEDKCLPYMKASHKNEVIGHLLDEAKLTKGPLVLEYLAELRNLANKNSSIQSGMEVTIEEFIEDEETDNFVYLFPLLQSEPTQDEMTFIDEHKLPLEKEERFASFQNPQYWLAREKKIQERQLAAQRQEKLLRAKKEQEEQASLVIFSQTQAKIREEELQKKLEAQKQISQKEEELRRIKVAEVCGEMINPEQFSGTLVAIEGKIIFIVDEAGDKGFGYGVKARNDQKTYFIRDPKNLANMQIGKTVLWKLKAMGRTEALIKESDTVFAYDKKSKTKFTMALFVKECSLK